MNGLMRSLFGEGWFFRECKAANATSDAPPLCATYGDWVSPRKRQPRDLARCTALGCLGHATLPRMQSALGPEILARTFFIVTLRDPIALFLSEYHYIIAELQKAQPSLQFVQDAALRQKMREGMTLDECV